MIKINYLMSFYVKYLYININNYFKEIFKNYIKINIK